MLTGSPPKFHGGAQCSDGQLARRGCPEFGVERVRDERR